METEDALMRCKHHFISILLGKPYLQMSPISFQERESRCFPRRSHTIFHSYKGVQIQDRQHVYFAVVDAIAKIYTLLWKKTVVQSYWVLVGSVTFIKCKWFISCVSNFLTSGPVQGRAEFLVMYPCFQFRVGASLPYPSQWVIPICPQTVRFCQQGCCHM